MSRSCSNTFYTGQSSLPETCPVCAHSPLDGASCKQNKSLRLTIKAFLKSEEKKRSKEIAETQPPPSATPVQADAPTVVDAAPAETLVPDVEVGAENPPLDNTTIVPPAGDEIVESVEQVSVVCLLAAIVVHSLIQFVAGPSFRSKWRSRGIKRAGRRSTRRSPHSTGERYSGPSIHGARRGSRRRPN